MFHCGFMCDGINAQHKPADDEYIRVFNFGQQFFSELFSIVFLLHVPITDMIFSAFRLALPR